MFLSSRLFGTQPLGPARQDSWSRQQMLPASAGLLEQMEISQKPSLRGRSCGDWAWSFGTGQGVMGQTTTANRCAVAGARRTTMEASCAMHAGGRSSSASSAQSAGRRVSRLAVLDLRSVQGWRPPVG